ncbi:hypothetical protein ACIQPS_35615 [Streptomyces sp. NPDC091290]|uniref:hypothetical protein n=1 Tax=Streptomyces sp. NPDC091290 TaxID=3365990 RepID=UPI00382A6FE8
MFAQFAELSPGSVYPVKVTVACEVHGDIEAMSGDRVVTISISPGGVTTPDGRDTLAVNRSQLIS